MAGEIFTWRESAINHLIFSFALPFGKMFIMFSWSLLCFMCIYSWGFYSTAHMPQGRCDSAKMLPSRLIIFHNQAKSHYTVVTPRILHTVALQDAIVSPVDNCLND